MPNNKSLESEMHLVSLEMKRKQRQCNLLKGKMKAVILVWSFLY